MSDSNDKPGPGRPKTGQIPKRIFRMDDEGWRQVEAAANQLGETTSAYVRRVLLRDSEKVMKKA